MCLQVETLLRKLLHRPTIDNYKRYGAMYLSKIHVLVFSASTQTLITWQLAFVSIATCEWRQGSICQSTIQSHRQSPSKTKHAPSQEQNQSGTNIPFYARGGVCLDLGFGKKNFMQTHRKDTQAHTHPSLDALASHSHLN